MPNASLDDLIRGLDEGLRGEWQAIIMYRLYASMVQAPPNGARATVTVPLFQD